MVLRLNSTFLILAIASYFLSGCIRNIAIQSKGFSTTEKVYENEMVHPYPELSYKTEVGPFLSVKFNSTSDLESEAKKYTHHLYFQMVPCSQDKLGYELLSGGVYKSPGNYYVAYIPINTELMLQNVNGYDAFDVQSYLDKSREEGLCFRVGGGQMWLGSLRSNYLKLPLYINHVNELKIEPFKK